MKRIILSLLIIGGILYLLRITPPEEAKITPPEAELSTEIMDAPAANSPTPVPALPVRAVIPNVPFVPQAPFKVWDARHEDACEEASLLTLKFWLLQEDATNSAVETELQQFIDWQEANGFGPSITLTELKDAAQQYWTDPWWTSLQVHTNASLDDLRRELAAGRPVVIGAAGRELKNPHFKNGGPNYHMLVLTGYEGDEFVTNDPGTQFGQDYRYSAVVIDRAWHDWNAADILLGARNYLVAE